MKSPKVDELSLPAFPVFVERGKVREFARATHAEAREYWSDSAPSPPPTFLTTSSWWADSANTVLDQPHFDRARMLHAEQEFEFFGPPPVAGTALKAKQSVSNRFTKVGKRGGELVFTVVLTEFRDHEDELVAVARSTVVETTEAAI